MAKDRDEASNICRSLSTGDSRVASVYMLPAYLNSFGFSGVSLEMKLMRLVRLR